MADIRKSLLQLIFSGAYLLRWNDKLRPVELLEIDKQAHKMLLACVLWHENSLGMSEEKRVSLANDIIKAGCLTIFTASSSPTSSPPSFIKSKKTPTSTAS